MDEVEINVDEIRFTCGGANYVLGPDLLG